MDESLPSEYDVIVFGTGMVESIVAAACAHVGKKVLHLDRNSYYGNLWATFTLEGLQKYFGINSENPQNEFTVDEARSEEKLSASNAVYIKTDSHILISDVVQKWSVGESIDSVPDSDQDIKESSDTCNVWTQNKIINNSRKFNLDLSPKFLYSRGKMVELLLSSQVSRYMEFISITNILTFITNRLEVVPCSKSDVFTNKKVSVIEKRILMKVLDACLVYKDGSLVFKGFEEDTFYNYLKAKKVPDHLIHYIIYAIVMGTKETPCLVAVKQAQQFLFSIGAYGNSPFLWPMYGSSELLQAFCRLCAVFGGIYYLNRGIESLVIEDGNCVGVISNNQLLSAKHVILSSDVTPKEFISEEETSKRKISRGILITDKPLYNSGRDGVSLVKFPPSEDLEECITLIELSSVSGACPKGLYIAHLWCLCKSSPQKDFEEIVSKLFSEDKSGESNENQAETVAEKLIEDKPRILYSLYFSIDDVYIKTSTRMPPNIFVCSGPDMGLDFESNINQAKEIFHSICPNEEFLEHVADSNVSEETNELQSADSCDNEKNEDKSSEIIENGIYNQES